MPNLGHQLRARLPCKCETKHSVTLDLHNKSLRAGLCSTLNQKLIDETFKFVLAEARDQDFTAFFVFLSSNKKTKRQLVQFVETNYDEIYKRFSGNTQLNHLISIAFKDLTREADAKELEEFFKDKDVSKFNLSLNQALDTIRSTDALIKRSTDDVVQWLESWGSRSKN